VLNRRFASLVAAVSVAGVAAAGCAEQSAAVRVDDATVSKDEVYDELELIADNDNVRAAALGPEATADDVRGDLAGSYSQDVVANVLFQRVIYLLADEVLADEGIEVTDGDRAAVVDLLDRNLSGGADSLPAGYRDDLVERLARLFRLQAELGGGQGVEAAIFEEGDRSTIEVSSQFGHWDADNFQVVPPDGPSRSPATGDDETGLDPG
jgi:hypothetical protein